jgi:hypothetical protein
MLVSVEGVRVLLTEGSSLTSREVVSCLGPCGYHVEVLDPDPLCLGRLSRWVRKIHRCPHAGTDPERYLATLAKVACAEQLLCRNPARAQNVRDLATTQPVGGARWRSTQVRLSDRPNSRA